MRKIAVVCFCVVALSQMAFAAAPDKAKGDDLPPIIASGLQAYKEKGAEEAVKAWIKGSAIDGSKEALSQASNLQQIQVFYGAYQGFEVAGSRDISPKVRILYLIVDFEKGPLFAKFVVYRAEQGWILTNFNFNTKEDLLPSPLP